MNFSTEQLAIFDWFKSGTGNLVIKARAGTGKTTTIKESFVHAPEKRILYAVFNKRNQAEAQEKIKDCRVDVKTLHALGFAFIRNYWRNSKPDDEVEADRLDSLVNLSNNYADRAGILKLIGFAKNTHINPTRDDLQELCEQRDIEFTEGLDGIDWCLKAMEIAKTQDNLGRISFNDMVWLPCALNLVKPIYNLVAIDECQDMSVPQLTMARGASNGRVVVIGDDRQMIYSFRGCHSDGIGMMKTVLRAKELTLTTTYRCPQSVVKIAQEIVPDFNAHESAPAGEVKQLTDTLSAVPGDAILSRLNAPLMPLALSLLRNHIPARIEGRDIGRQLIGMVKSQRAKSVPHFFERVTAWMDKQVKRLGKTKNADKKIDQSRDIADTLMAVAEGCKSVAEIEARIYNLFQDTDSNSKPAVVLSSVHKAKGLEWKRVFVLTETFRRGKGIEEENLWYVAVTRSMGSLFFVGGKKSVSEMPESAAESVRKNDMGAAITLLPPTIQVQRQPTTTAQILGTL